MKKKQMWAGLVMGMVAGVLLSGSTEAAPQQVGPSSQTIQYCSRYDGKACSSPGTTFLCYNQYPYEPGLCECTDSGTWSCG